MDREALVRGTPAPGGSGTLLADEGGGRHLATRHAIDSVVHEKDSDLLPAVGGVDDLRRADGRQIAVALIGNYDFVRAGSFDSGGHSGGAAVRGLHVAYVKIVVGKHRATHGTDKDGL